MPIGEGKIALKSNSRVHHPLDEGTHLPAPCVFLSVPTVHKGKAALCIQSALRHHLSGAEMQLRLAFIYIKSTPRISKCSAFLLFPPCTRPAVRDFPLFFLLARRFECQPTPQPGRVNLSRFNHFSAALFKARLLGNRRNGRFATKNKFVEQEPR